jgi:hypothetical protein
MKRDLSSRYPGEDERRLAAGLPPGRAAHHPVQTAFFEQCGDDVRAERLAGVLRRPARFLWGCCIAVYENAPDICANDANFARALQKKPPRILAAAHQSCALFSQENRKKSGTARQKMALLRNPGLSTRGSR